MMGSILAVEAVPPSRILSTVHGDDQPDFESINDAREFMGTLMALWNHLSEHQASKNPFHFSRIPNIDGEDKEGWVKFSKTRESEISYFLQGLYAGNTPPTPEPFDPYLVGA